MQQRKKNKQQKIKEIVGDIIYCLIWIVLIFLICLKWFTEPFDTTYEEEKVVKECSISMVDITALSSIKENSVPELTEDSETRKNTVTEVTEVTGVEESHREKEDWEWSSYETYLLAKVAMAEAEGEDTEGKALVILVVLNRVNDPEFPDTIEGVITEKNAFSTYMSDRWELEPSEDCYQAIDMVQNEAWDESYGATYFEMRTDKSTWHSKNLEELFEHGGHTFYKEVEAE